MSLLLYRKGQEKCKEMKMRKNDWYQSRKKAKRLNLWDNTPASINVFCSDNQPRKQNFNPQVGLFPRQSLLTPFETPVVLKKFLMWKKIAVLPPLLVLL